MVKVYCDNKDCYYCRDKMCKNRMIEISENGKCKSLLYEVMGLRRINF